MSTEAPVTEQAPLRSFTYTVAMDNYEPVPRTVGYGSAEVYHVPNSDTETVVLLDAWSNFGASSTDSIYLVDDGNTVEPWYVSGWQATPGAKFEGCVFLQRFPLSQGTRPDNGRPIDMSNWMLGPRRCYHLKAVPA